MTDVPTRLLRETLRAALTPGPSTACIDADTLAAWSDARLTAGERAAVQSHAADCARCQALLAAAVRVTTSSAPAPAQTASKRWQSWPVGWLVPLAVAAAGVAFWIAVPSPRLQAPGAPAKVAPAPSTTPAPAPAAGSTPVAAEARIERAQPPASLGRTAELKKARKERTAPPPSEPRRAEKAEVTAPDAVGIVAGPPPSAAAPRVDGRMAQLAQKTVPLAASAASASAADKLSAAPTEIVSPDPNVRWRILMRGRIDRSIDGGQTWETQSLGIVPAITAGSAPSNTVCWLVGPGGLVTLSTNGQTWNRVSFPEVVNLTSVRASDRANAIVTAADGRTFTTSDGGQTWRVVARP